MISPTLREQAAKMAAYAASHGLPYKLAKRELEQAFVREYWPRLFGNKSRIAKKMGIHRNTLARRIGTTQQGAAFHV